MSSSPPLSTHECQSPPDQVVLSGVVVDTQGFAEELYNLVRTGIDFERLVETYSPSESEPITSLTDEPFKYRKLPGSLKEAVSKVQLGSLIRPTAICDLWGVFRVEAFLPAGSDCNYSNKCLSFGASSTWWCTRNVGAYSTSPSTTKFCWQQQQVYNTTHQHLEYLTYE